MSDRFVNIVICSCEDTMPVDLGAVRRGCGGAQVTTARQLCGAELNRFRTLAADGRPLTVGCTQEEPLFAKAAAESGRPDAIQYANIRETAGWSTDASGAGPKVAALLAVASESAPAVTQVEVESGGAVLIYGRDEAAVEAGTLLKEHLDVTVLLTPPAAITPSRVTDFPVVKGNIRTATGHLGAFDIVVDDFAQPAPSSRGALSFGQSRDNARSRCDIILDLSGGTPLFVADELRDGYLRADPRNSAAMLQAVLKARDLVGTFEKPRYITYDAGLCAHSRSQIVGCTRCLDLCPAGAITPNGDHVAIDPHICAGCGQCAAVCPTGAAAYAVPPVDTLMRKLRAMLLAYREAGGEQAVILLHDEPHGTPLIDALARFGEGLPAHVLPLAINELTQVGLESIACAFAYGAAGVRLLLRAKPRHDITGLLQTIELADPILVGLGFGTDRVATIQTDDPDVLGRLLRASPPLPATQHPASFLPMGDKRGLMRLALRELQRVAPEPVDVIALPKWSPFGSVEIDVGGCTLCLACVSACPTGALHDDPERPMLRFVEDACVQCGLCRATCPEKVITLKSQIDFRATTASKRTLKEEEPFCCIRCSKPFGVKSTIERVTAKLEGSHWMYKEAPQRLDLIKMCDDCRVAFTFENELDPHAAPRRPVRTTDHYLREREKTGTGGQ